MNKILFLMAHTPIPRSIKRIHLANKENQVYVCYWDRLLENEISFTIDSSVEIKNIKLKAPQADVKKKIFKMPIFFGKAITQIRKIKPDVLHVFNLDMLLLASLYKRLFDKNVKVIYEIGDLNKLVFKDNMLSKVFKKMESFTSKDVDILIVTSEKFYTMYYKNYISEQNRLYLPNVPSKKLLANYSDKGQFIESGDLIIGFIGAIRYFNELAMLCDVSKILGIRVQFSGTGIDFNRLKNYTISDTNVTLTGAYNYKEISKLYSSVDLIYSVYDSNLENVKVALPNRLYEAIIFEKPIIVAEGTYLSEFVKTYNIGYIVNNNKRDLEICLKSILNNKDEYNEKKLNCKLIKEQFFLENYEEDILNLYRIK